MSLSRKLGHQEWHVSWSETAKNGRFLQPNRYDRCRYINRARMHHTSNLFAGLLLQRRTNLIEEHRGGNTVALHSAGFDDECVADVFSGLHVDFAEIDRAREQCREEGVQGVLHEELAKRNRQSGHL